MYAKEVSKRGASELLDFAAGFSRHQKNLMRAITVEFDWRTCGANLNSCALCRNYISAIAMKISFRQAAAVAALVRASGRQSLGERGCGGLGGAATG
jgi:hypothetical protein